MKKLLLLASISTAIIFFLSSCSTPPPPDTEFNLSSDDPYRQGQNLVEAIAHGANSAAYRLMERGAPLNYQDKKDEWTPLIYAIYHNNWRMSKVLIRAGANVNLADSASRTPLMWAALRNSGITATLLVEYGANINAVDISGRTALQYAIIYTNYTLAAYLADAGRKPPAHRLKKEQFARLEDKRKRAKAEAENLKLFGTTRKREVIAKMKKDDLNINIKKAKVIESKKTVKPKKTDQKKKTVTPKPEAAKPTPKKVNKPIKITDILNAAAAPTKTPTKTPVKTPVKASPKALAIIPAPTDTPPIAKVIKPKKAEPTQYVKPMRLLMPRKTKKKKPSTTTIRVAPGNPSTTRNPYTGQVGGGPNQF